MALKECSQPAIFFGYSRSAVFLKFRDENIFAIRGGVKKERKQALSLRDCDNLNYTLPCRSWAIKLDSWQPLDSTNLASLPVRFQATF
jgi:hypothetical protein